MNESIKLTEEEEQACGQFILVNLHVDKGHLGIVAEVLRRLFVSQHEENFEKKVMRFLASDAALIPFNQEEKEIADSLVKMNEGLTSNDAKSLIMRRRVALKSISDITNKT